MAHEELTHDKMRLGRLRGVGGRGGFGRPITGGWRTGTWPILEGANPDHECIGASPTGQAARFGVQEDGAGEVEPVEVRIGVEPRSSTRCVKQSRKA
ncbi:MAG: hypothetical protein HZY76_16405 [Anaerolineae bacterium]|nr:MAG: hypothetical protein HZY76_16405 [Anaerolineae bacterium]